jgi:hypothetical protein
MKKLLIAALLAALSPAAALGQAYPAELARWAKVIEAAKIELE